MSLLIASAGIYFGVNVGEVYWRFYQFQDEMTQEVRFASNLPNDVILRRVQTAADSIGLPEDAADAVRVRRVGRRIQLQSDYDEHVELPMFARDIHFHPHAEGEY